MVAGSAAALAATGIVPRAIELPLIVFGSLLAGAPGIQFISAKNRSGGLIRRPIFSV